MYYYYLKEEDRNLIDKAKTYALDCHEKTNHLYDGKPYETHLSMVYKYVEKYSHLLNDSDKVIAFASAWTHDTIEDCRQTYNDVKNACNVDIAEVTYTLTNEKGKTRKDRANYKYYAGIRENPVAVFVKICDRLANASYSKESGSSMINAYKKEHTFFKNQLFSEEFKPMWTELREILEN